MAQEKEGFSNKNSPNNNSDSEDNALTNGNNPVKPDLGFENVNYSSTSDQGASTSDKNTASKTSTQSRKEESPFSFKHFLKRDLSLPSTSPSYESTGAKPKIYTNAVHPSLAKVNLHQESKKEAKVASRENWAPSNASSDSSIELILNSNNPDSKNNLLDVDSDMTYNRRPPVSSDPLGLPSLPDFVQDHLLVEQAYLGNSAPLSVDFDNLPDFTFNSHSNFSHNLPAQGKLREFYDTGSVNGAGSSRGPEACRPSPLDLPNHLTLDLTDSLNHSDRRDEHRLPFPLDLPNNTSGCEPLRLPDFLPAQAGAAGGASGGSSRNELAEERRLRTTAERELRAALQNAAQLRREAQEARAGEQQARRELVEARGSAARLARELRGAGRVSHPGDDEENSNVRSKRNPADDNQVTKLKCQVNQLKEELAVAHAELEELRGSRRGTARSLLHATNTAEASLRELLSGLAQLRGLASSLDPP